MIKAAPKEFVFFLLRDNLLEFSPESIILKNSYPFSISLNRKLFSVFVNEIHDSGHGRSNEDECRIQINREQWAIALSNNSIFLGFDRSNMVFSLWETGLISERENPSTFSIYSRFSKLKEAGRSGYSLYEFYSPILKKRTFCLNFEVGRIGQVLSAINSIWENGGRNLDSILSVNKSQQLSSQEPDDGSKQSERFKRTVTSERYQRNTKFRNNVLNAYMKGCAFCSLQLDVVEAAHIIPHSHDMATDTVQNGIALCANHHKMFDSGLLGLEEDLTLKVNWKRLNYLEALNLSSGSNEVKKMHGSNIFIPTRQELRPLRENILLANKIRGIDWE